MKFYAILFVGHAVCLSQTLEIFRPTCLFTKVDYKVLSLSLPVKLIRIDNVPLYDLIIWVHVPLVIYSIIVGRFSEAGLHEWISFVIFRARNREWWQCHFRADFWVGVMLCITMEVEPRIAKQYKCSCKNYRGKRMEGGQKVSLRRFLADQKIASSLKKMRFGASYSMSSKLLLVARHILTTGLQKCL